MKSSLLVKNDLLFNYLPDTNTLKIRSIVKEYDKSGGSSKDIASVLGHCNKKKA